MNNKYLLPVSFALGALVCGFFFWVSGGRFGSGTTTSVFGNISVSSITSSATITSVTSTATDAIFNTVSSTQLTLGSGTPIKSSQSSVFAWSPLTIAAYDTTSTSVALSSAVSGNLALVTLPQLWSTSTVMAKATAFGGVLTVTLVNTSATPAALTTGQSLRVTTLGY